MRILIVEDEAVLRDGLRELLSRAGHDATACGDGREALDVASRGAFDLLILDVGLPGLDGIECCRSLRERGKDVPIIVLTALGDESDKVRGLEAGADDFVTKPFGSRELLARILAVSRRAHPSGVPERLEVDDCSLDLGSCRATRDGRQVTLSAREAEILRWLRRHEGRGVSRADLLRHVWGVPGHLRTRAVDMAISTLRQKIERDPARPRIVVSVKGVGYAWGSG